MAFFCSPQLYFFTNVSLFKHDGKDRTIQVSRWCCRIGGDEEHSLVNSLIPIKPTR